MSELKVPKDWESIPLENCISDIIGGDWGENDSESVPNDYVRVKVIRATEMKYWDQQKGKSAIFRLIKKSSLEKRQLKSGNIILEISGGSSTFSVGRSVLIDNDALIGNIPVICANFFRKISLKERFEPAYISYFLDYFYASNQIQNYITKSTNLQNLKVSNYLSEVIVPIPSINIQQKIVQKLDHILEQLEEKEIKILSLIEQNKERINFFEKNFLSEIMKKNLCIDNYPKIWNVKTLGEITDRIGGGTPKKNNEKYYQGDICWITISDISNEITYPKIIEDSKMKITEQAIVESSAKKIPKDAVVLGTRVGVGKLGIAGRELTTNQDFTSFVCSKEIDPYFLACYFLAIRQQLHMKSRGVSVKGITVSELDNLRIGYPSTEEQKKIVQNIKHAEEKFKSQKIYFENIRKNYDSKIKYINHIQSSILDSAFSGKLVPQDPNDESASELLKRIKLQN